MNNMRKVFCGLAVFCVGSSNGAALPDALIRYRIAAQICDTNFSSKEAAVSKECRHLFYKALRDCGHKYPEHVVVENGNDTRAETHYYNNCLYHKITFDEKRWSNFPIGVRRIVAFHEAMHIVKRHNGNSIIEEREADCGALTMGKCRKCALESAQWHFEESKRKGEREYKSLEEIAKKTEGSLRSLLDYTQIRSFVYKDTHPLHVERGLTTYLRLKEMSSSMCDYHEIEEVGKYLV
ncbi:MAG: hypothetical protein P4L31_00525 [Candidatus Babeliales bacterium]|nr:hypothetical protein [Candidatus Babeliales bacterium]